MWIAEFRESLNLWTQLALLFIRSMSVWGSLNSLKRLLLYLFCFYKINREFPWNIGKMERSFFKKKSFYNFIKENEKVEIIF